MVQFGILFDFFCGCLDGIVRTEEGLVFGFAQNRDMSGFGRVWVPGEATDRGRLEGAWGYPLVDARAYGGVVVGQLGQGRPI